MRPHTKSMCLPPVERAGAVPDASTQQHVMCAGALSMQLVCDWPVARRGQARHHLLGLPLSLHLLQLLQRLLPLALLAGGCREDDRGGGGGGVRQRAVAVKGVRCDLTINGAQRPAQSHPLCKTTPRRYSDIGHHPTLLIRPSTPAPSTAWCVSLLLGKLPHCRPARLLAILHSPTAGCQHPPLMLR